MPTVYVLQFVPKHEPEIVDAVEARRDRHDGRYFVEPETNAVYFRSGQCLDHQKSVID
jgi:hypothetical protein